MNDDCAWCCGRILGVWCARVADVKCGLAHAALAEAQSGDGLSRDVYAHPGIEYHSSTLRCVFQPMSSTLWNPLAAHVCASVFVHDEHSDDVAFCARAAH